MAKILIVDDQQTNRMLLQGILSQSEIGYQLLQAGSGQEALEIVKKDLPDIILLDVQMPGINGLEVCRALKEDSQTSAIPILFITAMEKTEDKVAGFEVGGADYITKPINPQEVKARIAAHLRIRQAEQDRLALEGLEAVKDLVVTCNHNMNQPLMAAMTYLEVLLSQLAPDDKKYSSVVKVKAELSKLSEILRKLQSLERLKRVDYVDGVRMIDLNEVK